jgi:predicted DNA-binding protein (MmcQ/YjbR family)
VARRAQTPDEIKAVLLAFGLDLPDAWIDHPWGETVVKVRKKVFVFLGSDDPKYEPGISVKLVDSHEQAMQAPGTTETGHGLGRAGWVSIPLRRGSPSVDVLTDWIEESYRQVALKSLVAELDARAHQP